MRLLTTKNTKILKSKDKGYLTWGMHLLPGKTCSRASKGCLAACLNTAGRGNMIKVQKSRAEKTKFFWNEPLQFINQLKKEISNAIKLSAKRDLIPVIRLNLTSDITWECYGIPQEFPDVQFMDYTKYAERCPPSNYHLTFSRSESIQNHVDAKKWLKRGGNVAVVFKDEMPEKYWGYPVHSGENDDLRFLDPYGIVGLRAKGRARKDESGFVV